ncbi:DNA polymerase I PolA [Mycobacteroides abscessus]|uniref:DNA polymerase n=1 Tax=Mycobacteroides abscessus TaxID=36809 RepID=UPI0005E46340|nr:DNA polymerase [Mycobacteroides abscessus]CPX20605.1 DNA polymerase I PolA [Mycobacteroides abscessus]CRG61224.1 DNA polymerase I PolA [Mycobacteroides abscessus]
MTAPTADLRALLRARKRQTLYVAHGESPALAIAKLRESLTATDFLAYDIETDALHPSDPRGKATSIQLGSKSVAVLLDPADPAHLEAAREMLGDATYRLTAHNASFDILRLTRLGVFPSVREAWRRTTDTFILGILVTSRNGKFGNAKLDLKSLTQAWCGEAAVSADAKDELQAVQKSMGTKGVGGKGWDAYAHIAVTPEGEVIGEPTEGNTWANIPRDNPEFVTYCAADVYDSAHLAEALDPVARSLWPDRVNAEHHITCLVTEMTHRGVRLDRQLTRTLNKEAHATLSLAEKVFAEHQVPMVVAKTSGNASPDREAVAAAIRAEGVPVPTKRTADGKTIPVLDKTALKGYAKAGSKVAAAFRSWNKAHKEITTNYRHYLRTLGERVHAEIVANEAVTGRMASRSPNLQNVPETAKACFIADDGMVFISADFSSIEMRVAAAVTGDPRLSRMYTEPLPADASEHDVKSRDPYWLIAWAVWGQDATVDDRKLAKIICLAQMYGGGKDTIAAQVDEDIDLVSKVLDANRRQFPKLGDWFKRNVEPTIDSGRPFWELPSGRFQTIDPTRSWAGFNLMIQGLARDLLLGAMFRLDGAGFGEYMLLPIHDEVLFQVPADQAEEMLPRIIAAMETTFQGVPITVEAKVLGPRWLEKTHTPKPTAA